MELNQSLRRNQVVSIAKQDQARRLWQVSSWLLMAILLFSAQAHGQVNNSADNNGTMQQSADASSLSANTQQEIRDYLVTFKGDTLYGKYKKPVFGHSAFIVDGKKITLDPQTYSAYHANGALYRSIQVSPNTEPTWMECIEDGAICLYQYIAYKTNGGVNDPRNLPGSAVVWLAQKNAGPLMNVNGVMATVDLAKHNLERLLLDSPDLSAEAKTLPFSTRTVQGLIKAYNKQFKPLKQP